MDFESFHQVLIRYYLIQKMFAECYTQFSVWQKEFFFVYFCLVGFISVQSKVKWLELLCEGFDVLRERKVENVADEVLAFEMFYATLHYNMCNLAAEKDCLGALQWSFALSFS